MFRFACRLMFLIAPSLAFAQQQITFYGNATDIKTGDFLYQEVHQLTVDTNGKPLFETVVYKNADDEIIGSKELIYSSLTAPSYSARYRYLDVAETVTTNEDQLTIERGQRVSVEKPDSLFTIDGGFHYLMLENFDQLLNAQPLTFDFLSPGRASFIPLKAQPKIKSDTVEIKLSLSNFLLAALVKPIELTYQTDTRQLLSYRGLTNLPNREGKLYSAQIDYVYPVQNAQNDTYSAGPLAAEPVMP